MPEPGAIPIRSYCMQYDSMEPTITANTDVLGDSSYYKKNRPQRWDVVVFTLPGSEGRYVKRIIGLPGETIHLTLEGLKIEGTAVSIPPILKDRFSSFKRFPDHKYGNEPFKIPADSVFLLGDNPRIYVADSRVFGPIPIRNLEALLLALVHTTPII